MSSWCYGLVEDDDLKLMEVYHVDEKPGCQGYYNLSWKDINEDDIECIIEDISAQLRSRVKEYKWVIKNEG